MESTFSGETYFARTHDDHNYNTSWIHTIGTESFSFWVQACNDVHLALATIPGQFNTLAYEVVIGKCNVRLLDIQPIYYLKKRWVM